MSGYHASSNTSRLFAIEGTFGSLQIVAADDRVLIDATTRNYDTLGHLHKEHALADLPLDVAVRFRDLLTVAIEHVFSVKLNGKQTALWSETTLREQAGRFGRRRAL